MDAAEERTRAAHNSRMEQAYMTAIFVRSEGQIDLKDYLVSLKTGEIMGKHHGASNQVPAQQGLKQWFQLMKSMES